MQNPTAYGHVGLLFALLAVVVALCGVEYPLAPNVSPAFPFAVLAWGAALPFVIVEAVGVPRQR